MKNVTLSVPDDVYRKARLVAARRETSVRALVAESLRAMAGGEDLAKTRRRLLENAFAMAAVGKAGWLPRRVALHDRGLLSR